MQIKDEMKFNEAEEFLLRTGDAYVESRIRRFNDLRLPKGSTDAKQCAQLCKIIRDYSNRTSPKRPLSIAMFGPPGSGKSFTVEQLAAYAQGYKEKPVTINLSQFDRPSQLTESLLHTLSSRGTHTPIILFDEFDTSLNGEELGWLKWFLAPMQDALFFHEGRQCPIPKAVFFFAGGTAERFEDFEQRHHAYFVKRKGPDFVSRLRGVMDIQGVNTFDHDRILRRALLLQFQIKDRAKQLYNPNGTLKIGEDVLRQLLDGGYYTHGARSVEALLDMCQLTEAKEFTKDRLPKKGLMKLHVSRGPLDGWTIGMSAGLFAPTPGGLITKLAESIINRGANLAYCGTLGRTLETVLDAAEGLTDPLVPCKRDYRIWHPAAFPAFNRPDSSEIRTEKVKKHVKFDKLQTLGPDEKDRLKITTDYFKVNSGEGYNIKHHTAWAISLFRMRVRFIRAIDALIVVGGKGGLEPELTKDSDQTGVEPVKTDELPWGRFPGVAEEVMLALAFKKPVYIIGMLQGAAKDVGILLGLSNTQLYTSSCLPQPSHGEHLKLMSALKEESENFRIPESSDLPQTYEELRKFFSERALQLKNWTWNGLTQQQNHELFNLRTAHIDRCVQLTMRGISHLHWRKRNPSADDPARNQSCMRGKDA